MALKIYDKLKPQGNYAAVEASDVEMPDGRRLSEVAFSEGGASMVVFDLATLGLASVDVDTGVGASLYMDTTEIAEALEQDIVQCVINMEYRSMNITNANVTFFPGTGTGLIAFMAHPIFVTIEVYDDHITVSGKLAVLKDIPPSVTADDNGKFLRVADGTWVAVSVDVAEEASF